MTNLVKIIILLTALSSSVFSAPSQLFYEKVILDGENIVHVEPILDAQNELSGFVYTNASSKNLIIDKFESDTIISINLPSPPLKTILRYSEFKDTMYLYTMTAETDFPPKIILTTFFNHTYYQKTITTKTDMGVVSLSDATHSKMIGFDLKFYPSSKNPEIVIYECTYKVDNYFNTIGFETNNVSTAIIYDLDLTGSYTRTSQSSIFPGKLFNTEGINYVYQERYYTSYDFTDQNNDGSQGAFGEDYVYIYDNLEYLNTELTTSSYNTYSIHIDNFAPSSLTDELIIHANSVDLLGNYGQANHIACYDFSNGSPSEIWYNDNVTGIDFSFIFKSKDLLIGTNNDKNILMLNYLNGVITDSAEIESSLKSTLFYETGNKQPLLNFVGISGDTVKSYRFDISTDIREQTALKELPNNFELFQNHPNPFNGETRLEFSTTENQYLKLSIFNILGQEIKTLAASRFSPGQYSYYWNGSDENGQSQSTGIYFARLESATTSDLIKLIYLK